MEQNLEQSSVEDLNLVGLSFLGTYLAPPYGLYIYGESLTTWGLIVLVALLIAECWWEGRAVGRALQDSTLLGFPVVGLLSGLSVVAQRANAMGMEWSGFFGPMRPRRKR